MYAIVEAGGRQWKVEAGSRLTISRMRADVGSQQVLDRVLLAHDGKTLRVGQPYCPGAKVLCEVLEHGKAAKVISYKFRRRENYRRIRGHRQPVTRLLVKGIEVP